MEDFNETFYEIYGRSKNVPYEARHFFYDFGLLAPHCQFIFDLMFLSHLGTLYVNVVRIYIEQRQPAPDDETFAEFHSFITSTFGGMRLQGSNLTAYRTYSPLHLASPPRNLSNGRNKRCSTTNVQCPPYVMTILYT